MRKIILIYVFVLPILGCNSDEVGREISEEKSKQLLLSVPDFSKSTEHVKFDEEDLKAAFKYIAYNGGGCLFTIFIGSESELQSGWVYEIDEIQVLTLNGADFLEAEYRRKENEKNLEKFKRELDLFLAWTKENIKLEKTHNYSDVYGALLLAQQILASKAYDGWERHLIISSDLIHDVRSGEPMRPVEFTVPIHLIRPSRQVTLTDAFGETTNISIYSRFQEVMMTLEKGGTKWN